MAPIPEDHQDKPPNDKDDGDLNDFSNPNLMMPIDVAESSEDSEIESDTGHNGYALLPQEPGECEDDSDSDTYEEEMVNHSETQVNGDTITASGQSVNNSRHHSVPEAVLSSEAGAAGPTVAASETAYHPDFLAKFPDGKIPSYMQVPNVPKDSKDLLWNQSRLASSKVSFDAAHENKILKAMSGFALPTENIPDWAKTLPDDQWQRQVLGRLRKDEQEEQVWSDQISEDGKSDDWVADFEDAD
ncbi:uncharacterized protein LOC101860397 isoform X2 [Aplysia californica]|uniref:Male-enhanced antigen 1 n=1 Tax=Aplysia californica TaxID=6500 RepID=A0ABM0JJ46_APLCA|nr:uncharacterized protein LOC101860397 isoform X2 [Aplysia californica]